MNPIDQANTIFSLAQLLSDFCHAFGPKLEGFHARGISPLDTKPAVWKWTQTMREAKKAAITFEPDTSKWKMRGGPCTTFFTEKMGVAVEIIVSEPSPELAAEFPTE